MNLPPSNPVDHSGTGIGTGTGIGPGTSARSQFAWGTSSQQQGTRRGLPSISTALTSSTSRSNISSSPSRSTFSPVNPPYNSVQPASIRQILTRTPSVSSASSPFSPLQSGSQQAQGFQLLPSSRSRNPASASSSQVASSVAALPSSSQGGGGGGSSGGGGGASRLARASPSLSQSSVGSPSITSNPASAPSSGQPGSLSKIVIAQVFLLLSTIKEDGDKAKWESQADHIRKLIESNGMEVYTKYFRRLLQSNASQIFPGFSRSSESSGSYNLLVGEVQKLTQDPEQAYKIAESIDTSESDLFRDFDLSRFMDHFHLDPLAKTALALACKKALKPDLRSKADAILASNFQSLLVVLASPPIPSDENLQDESASFLATIIDRILQDPPRNWRDPEDSSQLILALALRYQRLSIPEPAEVAAVMHLADILGGSNGLVRLIQRTGPKGTASVEACKEMLATVESREVTYYQVASVLLFMVITEHGQAYNPGVFVTALRQHRAGQRLDWQDVVGAFDRESLRVTKHQFLGLFNALFPLAKEFENFDIQLLWGGQWNKVGTQLSFVAAFLSLTVEELDASTIPRLRRAFKMEEFEDASEEVKAYAAKAVRHPWVSLDAATALFSIIFGSQEAYNHAHRLRIPDIVINANTDIVACSASAIPKPWSQLQDTALKQLVCPFLKKRLLNHAFVLHALEKHDMHWLLDKIHDSYLKDRKNLDVIYEQAVEHGWVDALLRIQKELAIDLAMLCYSRGSFDLEAWLQQCADASPEQFSEAVGRFLLSKASAELDFQRDRAEPQTLPLTLKAVFTTVSFLSGYLPEEYQVSLQRACIQAYPRLINYGEGFDDIIDANSKDGHALSPEMDARMQEHYKEMYGNASTPTEIVQLLIRYKSSRDPAEQDLFACMIHGLFDEYNCFVDYPLEALAPTAVLFGGLIKHNVLPGFALGVALFMVLESVERFSTEDGMYKFGLQALGNCIDRLSEWPGFCKRLISVPQLQGTQVYRKAQEVVHQRGEPGTADANGHGDGAPMTNGDLDALYVSHIPSFTCLHVDPPIREGLYEDPDERSSNRVLFALNNLSESNLESRLREIKDVLEEKHHQWFALNLVEQRVKSEPNYHKLYLDMLDVFDDRTFWTEVLRETYVSVIRMLNAESTMNMSTERAHLKNLGAWLGSITLARNKPIKFKNISFKDLLIEGHDTQRLIVVIPFTCKVMVQAAKSTVFKPPNAWTMEIVRLLVELYHFGDLRLNLKFEIEVLCKDLGLDYKTIEPSDSIRSRPVPEEDFEGSTIVDGLEGFNGLPAIMSLNRARAANPRYSLAEIYASLPDVNTLLVFPPSLDSVLGAHRLRQICIGAVNKSLSEIIQPVVERSVTIAAIATSQVVIKDFATEPDESKLRQSAHNVVKALAGSLGLVTCKEPLRASITNNIKVTTASEELPLAEGILAMFVNDNLDAICGLVEQAAETQSLTEIDIQIEDAVQARLRHRASQPNQRYEEPALSTWSRWIQPPYQQHGPLNREQMAVYEDFGRQVRPLSTNVGTASQDSGRQMHDAIQDNFPSVPHLPTPAEAPTTQRHVIQQPQQRLPAAPPVQVPSHQHVNGYMDNHDIGDRIQDVMMDMRNAAREAPEYTRLRYLRGNDRVNEIYNRLVHILDNLDVQRDVMMWNVAQKSVSLIYQEGASRLEIEVFVALLSYVCQASADTARAFVPWFAQLGEDRLCYTPVTVPLVIEKLLDINRVDSFVAKAIYQRRVDALHLLRELVEEFLLVEEPIASRPNFARSLEALTAWLIEDPDLEIAKQISNKLRVLPTGDIMQASQARLTAINERQLMYVFDEWVELQEIRGAEKALTAFVHQLHKQHILEDRDACSLFFRLCIDRAVTSFINEPCGSMDAYGQPKDSFLQADALAKLIAYLVINQGATEEDQGLTSKAAYLESILALVILLLSHDHQSSREPFPQKLYYRIFSSIICEFQHVSGRLGDAFNEIVLVLGKSLLAMQPGYLPKFAFAWLALVSHPTLMPALLKLADQSGWDLYVQLIQAMLAYGCELTEPANASETARDMYRGVLRVLVVLHHDFPEFLVENHFSLCNYVPARCTQLRNLIVSAIPSSFSELPDPFTAGLKVDRLEEIRKSPTIRGDIEASLRQAHIKNTIDNALGSSDLRESEVQTVISSIHNAKHQRLGFAAPPGSVGTALLNALVIYLGTKAITSAGSKGPSFSSTSPTAMLFSRLASGLNPESRFHLISAIINQLRYPNSHTHYFSYALLHLFGTSGGAGGTKNGDAQDDALQAEIQQQITTVLLERLIVHRPHPWGLIITLLEILKNPIYAFWELDFVKAAPEVERYFSQLFQLRGQSPRNLS